MDSSFIPPAYADVLLGLRNAREKKVVARLNKKLNSRLPDSKFRASQLRAIRKLSGVMYKSFIHDEAVLVMAGCSSNHPEGTIPRIINATTRQRMLSLALFVDMMSLCFFVHILLYFANSLLAFYV